MKFKQSSLKSQNTKWKRKDSRGQSVCSSWESVFIPRCGQGNLCTRALPDDCAQNKTAAEWTCLSVSPGNAELISGPYSKDEWDGVAHLGDPQQLGSSSPAACVL